MAVVEVAITALATLTASFGTHWFAARTERQRREDERRLRELDREHEVRLALREDRLNAYRVLKTAIREQVKAHDEFATRWAGRLMLTERLKTALPDETRDLIREFDAHEENRRAALARASDADRGVEVALDAAELVASTRVADSIRALSGFVLQLRTARLKWAKTAVDDAASVDVWTAVSEAERAVEDARMTLTETIRWELGLDA